MVWDRHERVIVYVGRWFSAVLGVGGMRRVPILLICAAAVAAIVSSASAQRFSPIRVEQTRPGGQPGAPRELAGGSERYMLAPAQPTPRKSKRVKRR
jgi:hypothetical protein